MSRSRPTDQEIANPATRWFDWSGEKGAIKYYDRDKKEEVVVTEKFTFIVLDQLSSVRGWHEASKSGIYSNEVRDTRHDAMLVKSFKGGIIAEGFYQQIKDSVKAEGGKFNTCLYIAFKDGKELKIGQLRFRGAALGAWMNFQRSHRAEIQKHAVSIVGTDEGKKGRVVFKTPVFATQTIGEQTNDAAKQLDGELQHFLDSYLRRTKREQANVVRQHVDEHVSDEEMAETAFDDDEPIPTTATITDDDIPF
jgi:hypothetical protein